MKRLVTLAAVCVVALAGAPASAQSKAKAENVPEIPYESVPNFFKMPPKLYSARAWASRRIPRANLRLHSQRRYAAVRVRQEGRIRARDRARNLRIRLRARGPRRQAGQHLGRRRGDEHGHQVQPGGPLLMTIGRRPEPVEQLTNMPARARTAREQAMRSTGPTDVGIGCAGQHLRHRRLRRVRVAKYDKNGRFMKSAGTRGNGRDSSTSRTRWPGCAGQYLHRRPLQRRVQVWDNDLNSRRSTTTSAIRGRCAYRADRISISTSPTPARQRDSQRRR